MTYDCVIKAVAGGGHRLGAAGVMKPFGYLQDRLFILSLSAYALNRLVVLPHLAGFLHAHASWAWPFLHSHFDDLLLMPAALPVVLWIQRLTSLRNHDGPPGWLEMFLHLVVWVVMAKVVGPFYCHIGVADPWDVPFFLAGGVMACAWWNRHEKQTVACGHEL